MLSITDIINHINEQGEENLTTELQIKKLEKSIPRQEFTFVGYVSSINENYGNIELKLFSSSRFYNNIKIFKKEVHINVTLSHPLENTSFDFTNLNLKDELKINCTFHKFNFDVKYNMIRGEYIVKIFISAINVKTIELLKTAKEIEEEERKTEKVDESKREKKQEEWRKMNDAATAKAELEKAAWWLKILIIPGILFLLFIYWFSTWK